MSKVKVGVLKKIKFVVISSLAVILTISFAKYTSSLLYDGKNSLKVYNALQKQKEYLSSSIRKLQLDNARLQKEYFELKNLEPEFNDN